MLDANLIALFDESLQEWRFLQLFLAASCNVKYVLLPLFHSLNVLIQGSQFPIGLCSEIANNKSLACWCNYVDRCV